MTLLESDALSTPLSHHLKETFYAMFWHGCTFSCGALEVKGEHDNPMVVMCEPCPVRTIGLFIHERLGIPELLTIHTVPHIQAPFTRRRRRV